MSREYTKEEVRAMFLEHVHVMIDYWNEVKLPPENDNQRYRMEGVAFSMLAALDGCSMGIPAFIVAPIPHHSDKAYNQKQDKNWFPENHEIEDKIKCDIGGSLHDQLKNHTRLKNERL